MDYLFISDIMWYFGHILTGSTIVISTYSYPLAVLIMIIGELLTVISRPIGRIKKNRGFLETS